MINNNPTKTNIPFRIFQWLGVFIGGVFPIFAFFIIAALFGIKDFVINKKAMIWILVLAGLILFNIVCLYNYEKHSHTKKFGFFLLMEAILSCVLTFLIVYHTGGSKNSLFSFTFLYIPSIVGYVYGKEGWNLKGAALAMLAGYWAGLYWYSDLKGIPNNSLVNFSESNAGLSGPINIELIYLALFALQLIVTIIIASQKDELRTNSATSFNAEQNEQSV